MFPIELGDRGDAVADVQRRLSALGYSVGPSGVDGVFAEETKKAVQTFQAGRSLADTGIVDEKTWRSLVEATVKLGDRLLYLRSPFFHGDDVRELQERLNTLGFNCGAVDGVFGRMTERAVRDFQTNTGLPADGIVGEATLTAMGKLRNITESKSATSLPRRRPKPFSSAAVFRHRTVEIVCGSEGQEAAARGRCEDLSERLKNLLELLGARVGIVSPEEAERQAPAASTASVRIAFDLGGEDVESGLCVEAFGERSVVLAETVRAALSASVTEMTDRGVVRRESTPAPVAAVVRLGPAAGEADVELLADEAFAQKVAVAVFDGLHAYFRQARGDA